MEEVDKVQDQVLQIFYPRESVSNILRSVSNILHPQVKALRKKIADAYAERLADNMTSCVTQ